MKISVIIPLYNKEKQIKDTIDSILKQDFTDFELIVVNDGSTDNSLKIIEAINDERVRIINQTNAGVSAARNKGMDEARGDYVFFIDADDHLLPGAFDLMMNDCFADIIVASFIQTDNDGKVTHKSINTISGNVSYPYKSYWKREISLRMGNMFIKRVFLKKVGFLRTDMTLYEDKEWNMRLLEHASVYSCTNIILDYNRGEVGLSHGFKPIEKDFANIASVKIVDDKYKKKIIGDFVFRRFVSRTKARDWHGVKRIWHNNSWRLLYCMYSCACRLLIGKK